MALIINNENVDTSIFIQSEEVLILKKFDFDKSNVKSYKLKNIQHSVNQNGDKNSTNSIIKHFEVCSAAASNCGNLIVICDTNNSLHLWKFDKNEWEIISTRNVMRKCHKIIFTNSCTEVILADRGGDVFIYSVLEYNREGQFALGHLSFITDICISSDDKLLVTSDRDGKIRVSSYPNCYSIESYCLGHEEFISSVFFLSSNFLLSGGGDGTLRKWNCKDGSELLCEAMYENSFFLEDLNKENIHLKASSEDTQESSALKKDTTNFAIQSIKFCKKLNLLVILYHFIEGITVYKICDNEFQYIQFIKLQCPAIDVLITTCGNLLVLIRHSPTGLLNFNFSVDTRCFVEADIENISSEIRSFYGDFKKIVNVSAAEPMLFKKNFDDHDDEDQNKLKQIKVV